MKTTRRGIPRLFLVLSLALAGLMILQVLLLKYAWDLKEQAFAGGAQSALAATVMALESREIEGSAYDYFFSLNDSSHAVAHLPRHVAPHANSFTIHDTRTLRQRIRRVSEERLPGVTTDSLVVVVAPNATMHTEVHRIHENRPVALRQVVGEWITRAPQPIRERLDLGEITTVLQEELAEVGITTAPSFGVVRPAGERTFDFDIQVGGAGDVVSARAQDSAEIVLASDNITDAELLASPYRQQLFPLDPFSSPFDLVVAFPASRVYLLKQIGPLWLASVLFITVIIYSFFRAWRTNAEQRRFADQLVDFINNMTHEFKTPISTVGLAGEAIARGDVREQPEVLERYVGMIRDENERMHRQVEKILQMARFERGDIELKRTPIPLDDLLQTVVDSFALQVGQRGGSLQSTLGAPGAVVRGDQVHLESIFSNLLDNAVKYSPGQPQVKLTSAVEAGFVVVKVTDQGQGIAREDQRRVFEKYYRCPTGNRHDVKGYGLGLSFVASLVKAHAGFVELHSLPGQGTTVTVTLPVQKEPQPTEESP